MMAVYLAPQKPQAAELIFRAGAERLGWTTDAPVREPRGNPRFTLWGLILAREFGDDAIYDKLAAHCEAHHEPAWDARARRVSPGDSASTNPIRAASSTPPA